MATQTARGHATRRNLPTIAGPGATIPRAGVHALHPSLRVGRMIHTWPHKRRVGMPPAGGTCPPFRRRAPQSTSLLARGEDDPHMATQTARGHATRRNLPTIAGPGATIPRAGACRPVGGCTPYGSWAEGPWDGSRQGRCATAACLACLAVAGPARRGRRDLDGPGSSGSAAARPLDRGAGIWTDRAALTRPEGGRAAWAADLRGDRREVFLSDVLYFS